MRDSLINNLPVGLQFFILRIVSPAVAGSLDNSPFFISKILNIICLQLHRLSSLLNYAFRNDFYELFKSSNAVGK